MPASYLDTTLETVLVTSTAINSVSVVTDTTLDTVLSTVVTGINSTQAVLPYTVTRQTINPQAFLD